MVTHSLYNLLYADVAHKRRRQCAGEGDKHGHGEAGEVRGHGNAARPEFY